MAKTSERLEWELMVKVNGAALLSEQQFEALPEHSSLRACCRASYTVDVWLTIPNQPDFGGSSRDADAWLESNAPAPGTYRRVRISGGRRVEAVLSLQSKPLQQLPLPGMAIVVGDKPTSLGDSGGLGEPDANPDEVGSEPADEVLRGSLDVTSELPSPDEEDIEPERQPEEPEEPREEDGKRWLDAKLFEVIPRAAVNYQCALCGEPILSGGYRYLADPALGASKKAAHDGCVQKIWGAPKEEAE